MRHVDRVETETATSAEDGKRRTLKPIAKIRKVRSQIVKKSQQEDEMIMNYPAVVMRHRTHSILPPKRSMDGTVEDNLVLDEPRGEESLEEPPRPGLACDDDQLEEMRDAPLGMIDEGAEEKKNFDLMNINITIYGVSGILCEEKEPKKSSGIKLVKRRSALKAAKAETPRATAIPTTVAASVKRNAISSQTVIETFLPSQPLNIQSSPGKETKLSASWQSSSSDDRHDENENPTDEHVSFEVLRMMMKKPFTRETIPGGLVENYVHEHVQIGINLCRGHELMRLGVATLIITGEEEGQVMMHIPARPCANPGVQERKLKPKSSSHNNKKKESKRNKKKLKMHFENDTCTFRLEENSSLFLGVQVNPRQDVEAAERYQEDIQPSESQLLRNMHAANVVMMETRDHAKREKVMSQRMMEHSTTTGIESFTCSGERATTTNAADSKDTNSRESNFVPNKTATTKPVTNSRLASVIPESMMTGIFCGALGMPVAPKCNNKVPVAVTATKSKDSTTAAKTVNKKKSSDTGIDDNNNGVASGKVNPVNRGNKAGLPAEIMNVKYAPEYAKSFFSAVTFADTEIFDDDDDDDYTEDLRSQAIEEITKRLEEA